MVLSRTTPRVIVVPTKLDTSLLPLDRGGLGALEELDILGGLWWKGFEPASDGLEDAAVRQSDREVLVVRFYTDLEERIFEFESDLGHLFSPLSTC